MQKEAFVPEKSPNDKRQYKAVRLANDLRLLMIQDPAAEKAACAISVRIGSLSDPDSSLGLAHFLEHMLFMGSGKYPKHNEYSEFIALNAGHDNAFTDDLETNYYFDIGTEKFLEGVDRMAEFFKSALLSPDCVEKERQAVHEEYMLWVNDDNCRKWGVLHQIANGEFSRFTIGNQETLNHPKILEDLTTFYKTYYSSNMINAVLLSNMDLNELETKVVSLLGDIPNKHVQQPKYQQPFKPNQLGKLVKIQSIKDEHIMEFFWVIDPLRELYKKHIEEYLSHILGHQGENSILNMLKRQGFASSLSAYEHHIVRATVIGVDITLTQEGYENYEIVYDQVIKYVANLKPDQKLYDQLKLRNALFFQFQEKIDNTSYVSKLAQRLHYYPLENVLNYKNIFEEFDLKTYSHILGQLTPSRLIVALSGPDPLEGATIEKYLKAPYISLPLPKLNKTPLQKLVVEPNPFLPVDITIHPSQPNAPRKLAPNVIYQQDYSFHICKGGITLNVYSNEGSIFQNLYSSWLESMLKTQIYDAETLGVDISYDYSGNCLSISHYGFSDTLIKLLKKLPQSVLKVFSNLDKAEGMFEIEHEALEQEYDNLLLEASNDVAEDYLRRLLNGKNNTTVEQDREILQNLEFQAFEKTAKGYWANSRLEWVFVGNFLEKDALGLAQEIESQLKAKSPESEQKGCLKLTKDISFQLMVPADQIKTSATLMYFQHSRQSFRDRLMMDILKTYVKEPFFNDLRTLKQLAYYVGTTVRVNRGILGMYFLLVSSNADPLSVAKQMKDFLWPFFAEFKNQTEEQVTKLKQAVLINWSQPHDSLQDLNSFIVSQVMQRTYGFDRKDRSHIESTLQSITKDDLIQLANTLLQHSLTIYVVAKCHQQAYKAAGPNTTSDFKTIKTQNEYFPDYIQDSLSGAELVRAKARRLEFLSRMEQQHVQLRAKDRKQRIEAHRRFM